MKLAWNNLAPFDGEQAVEIKETGSTIFSVSGKNGSGKSTFLEIFEMIGSLCNFNDYLKQIKRHALNQLRFEDMMKTNFMNSIKNEGSQNQNIEDLKTSIEREREMIKETFYYNYWIDKSKPLFIEFEYKNFKNNKLKFEFQLDISNEIMSYSKFSKGIDKGARWSLIEKVKKTFNDWEMTETSILSGGEQKFNLNRFTNAYDNEANFLEYKDAFDDLEKILKSSDNKIQKLLLSSTGKITGIVQKWKNSERTFNVNELSTGLQKTIDLISWMLTPPKNMQTSILIVDELTAFLNENLGRLILRMAKKHLNDKIILFTSQNNGILNEVDEENRFKIYDGSITNKWKTRKGRRISEQAFLDELNSPDLII